MPWTENCRESRVRETRLSGLKRGGATAPPTLQLGIFSGDERKVGWRGEVVAPVGCRLQVHREELPSSHDGKPGRTRRRHNPLQVRLELLEAPWRAHFEQRAHEQAQVVRRGREQISLANVLDAREPRASGSSCFAHIREAAFQPLDPQPLQFPAAAAARPSAVGIDGRFLLGRLISPDARVFQLRLGDVAAIRRVLVQFGERAVGMVPLVGHQIDDLRLAAGLLKVDLRLMQAVFERVRIGIVRVVDLRRENRVQLQIDNVLGLVGQVRRAVFHPGDAGVGIGGTGPLLVRDFLVRAGFVELSQVFVAGRIIVFVDATLLFHQPREVFLPVLARILADDALHRGVGLQGGGIDAHRLALE